MLEPFLLTASAAGIAVAVVAGVMGCFIVWRRMAYFSDSLAHSALLGIALGFVVGLHPHGGIIIVCLLFASLLLWLQQKGILATDTLLGILAHGGLSIGMVTLSILEQRIDLHAYLFGDILTVTTNELLWICGGGAVILGLLIGNWSSLVLMTIHEDLARAEGVRVPHMHGLFMLLMTMIVAVSIHVVGILLISSLLIIPAATARCITRSPHTMAVMASIIGVMAVMLGMYGSLTLDTPSGPSIVVASVIIFVIVLSTLGMARNDR